MSPLFRRRADGAAATSEPDETAAPTEADEIEDDAATSESTPSGSQRLPRPNGPWDSTEVSDLDAYVDLGALRIKPADGMELRLEIEEASGRVTAATVALGSSAVQLQVFAAPRSEGIWDEIRTEIASGITRQGGTVDETPGPFGRELIARIPVRTADGRTGHQPARFAGVDGPRWFLRAVFHGAAVHDPEQAAAVERVVQDAVIVRGAEAMAPRDLLELKLPDAALQPPAPEPASLDPFERGPEITEIR